MTMDDDSDEIYGGLKRKICTKTLKLLKGNSSFSTMFLNLFDKSSNCDFFKKLFLDKN